jgi:hypothetical protein
MDAHWGQNRFLLSRLYVHTTKKRIWWIYAQESGCLSLCILFYIHLLLATDNVKILGLKTMEGTHF